MICVPSCLTKPAGGTVAATIAFAFCIHVAGSHTAKAAPLFDPPALPGGIRDLADPDAQDLQHQLQLINGLPLTQPGWTFQPRLGFQEIFSDNVQQAHSPRRWDFSTLVAPGFSLVGNTRRVEMRLDYAPSLIMNARTGSQNAIGQQLNGTATITAVDDLAFLDIRALAGVQSAAGGIGGQGAIGASDTGGITAGGAGTTANRIGSIQTNSIGFTPYLSHQFGDYGTGRLSYSLNLSQATNINGVRFLPVPTGSGGQSLISQEQAGQFKTGDILNFIQDTVSFSLSQSHSTFGNLQGFAGVPTVANYSTDSTQSRFGNELSYALSHNLSVQMSLGYENIKYGTRNQTDISGMTWSGGITWTPNPDSSLNMTYGRQNGTDSFGFDGHYRASAFTEFNGAYHETIGTQLQNLQRQLNQGVVGNTGGFVNGNVGGSPFGSVNALGLQPGVFRFKTLSAGATTTRSRDQIGLSVNVTEQTTVGGATAGQTGTTTKSASLSWTHELRDDLRWTSSISYSLKSGGIGGSGNSYALNTGVLHTITPSLSASLRYSFYNRKSSVQVYSFYENLLVLGITKTF